MVYNVEAEKWEETVCLVDKKEPIQIESNFSEQSTQAATELDEKAEMPVNKL